MNPLYHTQPGPPSWNNYNAVHCHLERLSNIAATTISQTLIFEMDNVMKPKYLLCQDDDLTIRGMRLKACNYSL